VLIAGCGYVGSALGEELASKNHEVFGLRRKPGSLPVGIVPVAADLTSPSTLGDLPRDLDLVFYLASPSGREDVFYRSAYVDGLRNLLGALAAAGQSPRRVFFASSTAVYGQEKGEWVDEDSPTDPGHFSGRRLLEAESLLLGSDFAATVVRFGGIYGPRRTRLLESVRRGDAAIPSGPPRYTNRIHRDDCVGMLHHLMELPSPGKLYVGVDSDPAAEVDVLQWMASLLGAPSPRSVRGKRAERGRGNKRCRNDRLLATGYGFRYPSYREGYSSVRAEGS